MIDIALPLRADDSPRSAYRVLERRATVTTVAVLMLLAGVAWWSTLGSAHVMSSMVQGLASVDTAMPFTMSAFVFMAMWMTMMVAMMFPTIAPIVLLHRMVVRRRGEGSAPTIAFVGGYLAVWAAVGLLPLVTLVAFRSIADGSGWVDRVGGAVLMLAGGYQFTRWKDTCLRACRSPLSFLATHNFGGGLPGALRAGLSHGLYCLGCCWAIMAVLIVLGGMQLGWALALALVLSAEKLLTYGPQLVRVTAAAALSLGFALLIAPSLLIHLISV